MPRPLTAKVDDRLSRKTEFTLPALMIKDITAKTLLSVAKRPDPWFGIKYTMNLYRGCSHQCIYCDSRSECLPDRELHGRAGEVTRSIYCARNCAQAREGHHRTGSMSDLNLPLEATRNLTGQALEVMRSRNFQCTRSPKAI